MIARNDPMEADMSDCIFCKIVTGEIPSIQIYNDDLVIAFRDINPVAPTHVLIVPKNHIPSVNDLSDNDELLMAVELIRKRAQMVSQVLLNIDGIAPVVQTHLDGLNGFQLQPVYDFSGQGMMRDVFA